MDIVIASAALFLLAPVLLMLSLFVRVCVGGPVFFAQERVGHNGRTFLCFKFRTMCLNADEVLERYLSSNASAAVEWRQNRKLMADPRVRPAGKVLRKLSLDELPQLFNVLRGDMSMVGPRPVVPSELDCYGEYTRDYVKARPGITGLWQVSGRNRISYTSRVALDRYYARRWSIGVDLAILIRTVPAVLRVGNTA